MIKISFNSIQMKPKFFPVIIFLFLFFPFIKSLSGSDFPSEDETGFDFPSKDETRFDLPSKDERREGSSPILTYESEPIEQGFIEEGLYRFLSLAVSTYDKTAPKKRSAFFRTRISTKTLDLVWRSIAADCAPSSLSWELWTSEKDIAMPTVIHLAYLMDHQVLICLFEALYGRELINAVQAEEFKMSNQTLGTFLSQDMLEIDVNGVIFKRRNAFCLQLRP